MTVSVEIRTTSGGGVRSKAAPGEELVHGSVRGKGLHPKLVEVLPPPEAFKASVHYPLLLTNSPFVKQTMDGVTCKRQNIEGINTRLMSFETDVACGSLEIHIKGLSTTKPGIFEGKKRFVHVAVQARMKRPISASSLCIGQELYNDVALPLWMRQLILTTASKAFSSTARINADGTPRFFMNPVVACCQLINASRPGEEPPLWGATEDVRLMLPKAVDGKGQPLSSERRRKFCDVPGNVQGAVFSPDLVYTFHFWQHYADFAGYKLSLGFLNLDLGVMQNRCPVSLTVKDVDSGGYAFSVFAWHERLLYGAGANALADGDVRSAEAAVGRKSGSGGGGGGVGGRLLGGVGRMFGR